MVVLLRRSSAARSAARKMRSSWSMISVVMFKARTFSLGDERMEPAQDARPHPEHRSPVCESRTSCADMIKCTVGVQLVLVKHVRDLVSMRWARARCCAGFCVLSSVGSRSHNGWPEFINLSKSIMTIDLHAQPYITDGSCVAICRAQRNLG